ncbi:MAG: hypothetical protein FWD57_17065, partial [Polyangiaceae bacterium]|nr:hypothetical protein [Polyangiaceae bacterium]
VGCGGGGGDGGSGSGEGGTGGEVGGSGGGNGGSGGSGSSNQEPCEENQTECGSECCDNDSHKCEDDTCKPITGACGPVGSNCGSGKVCVTADTCEDGCFIVDKFVARDTRNDGNSCQACTADSTTEWTTTPGASCDSNGGTVCNASAECVSPATLAAGDRHTCAVTSAGALKCWGSNIFGLIDKSKDTKLIPVQVPSLSANVKAVSTGYDRTCVLKTDGNVYCWGHNYDGDGPGDYSDIPTQVNGFNTSVVTIASGRHHHCAITATRAVYCWDRNSAGQGGIDSHDSSGTAKQVLGLDAGAISITGGATHSCAVMNPQGPLCWGSNAFGQLGDSTTTQSLVPVAVVGLDEDLAAVSAGDNHTCGITSGGDVFCWGQNTLGQLGDGSTDPRTSPTKVMEIGARAIAISAGAMHTCVLTENGTVKCWGGNSNGQIGNGTTSNQLVAVEVSALGSGIHAVSAGQNHTCAQTASRTVKCWGANTMGQLGSGSSGSSFVPVDVVGLP